MANSQSASQILLKNDIPCVIWAEYALYHYGVPCVAPDYFLLVENTTAASLCLLNHGYTNAPPNPRFQFVPEFSSDVLRFWSNDDNERFRREEIETDQGTSVVLLPSEDWGYSLLKDADTQEGGFPSLKFLFEGIVTRWLDADAATLGMPLQVFLGYMYHYIAEMKNPSFRDQLRPFFQEFHDRFLERTIWLGEQGNWRKKMNSMKQSRRQQQDAALSSSC